MLKHTNRAALLLIDLQQDYLERPNLEPHARAICAQASALRDQFQSASLPVVHVWTTVRNLAERMPHWRDRDIRICLEGTSGHHSPLEVGPAELVIHKQYFSAFAGSELGPRLEHLQVDALVLAGVFLRACIRTTAIDAYQRGFTVVVAEDAVGDTDPIHAAVTAQYLKQRSIRFLPVRRILDAVHPVAVENSTAHQEQTLPSAIIAGSEAWAKTCDYRILRSPRDGISTLYTVSSSDEELVSHAVSCGHASLGDWQRLAIDERRMLLVNVASAIEAQRKSLADQICRDVGKPISDAHAELTFAQALIRASIEESKRFDPLLSGDDWLAIRRPQGVVAIITPWNNPLAIPLGKIAPALLYGNTAIWKPALPGAAVAIAAVKLLHASGIPSGVVNLINGGAASAAQLIAAPAVAAVTITGSTVAGTSAEVIAAARRVPFQAEMGGNNAAIVWADADLHRAAQLIANGAFGFAGQRCTATSRVIVDQQCFDSFLDALDDASRALSWGDPLDRHTDVGPVISATAVARLAGTVARARQAGGTIRQPLERPRIPTNCRDGCYFPPTLVVAAGPHSEIWQTENFGPLLAVQAAASWDEAIELCNGVPQGLVASLFTESQHRQADFVWRAEAGMLRINTTPAGASPHAPFCGTKCSSVGPPEHSVSDIEFYTRWQTLYNADPSHAAGITASSGFQNPV